MHYIYCALCARGKLRCRTNNAPANKTYRKPLGRERHCLLQQPLLCTPTDDRLVTLRLLIRLPEQYIIPLGNRINELHKHAVIDGALFLRHS